MFLKNHSSKKRVFLFFFSLSEKTVFLLGQLGQLGQGRMVTGFVIFTTRAVTRAVP